MVDYRRGDYAKSAEWCNQALSNSAHTQNPAIESTIKVILAMARFQMNQPAEAQKELARAQKAIETSYPIPPANRQSLHPDRAAYYEFFDWAYARIILREAKTLIEGGGETTADTK